MGEPAALVVDDSGFLASQCSLLEQIAAGAPLTDLLEAVVRLVEHQADGMRCSLMLFDPLRATLQASAAPKLPPEYLAAIDGIVIGPQVGTCGTAAFFRQVVVTEDIASDPNWASFAPLALAHGLRS